MRSTIDRMKNDFDVDYERKPTKHNRFHGNILIGNDPTDASPSLTVTSDRQGSSFR